MGNSQSSTTSDFNYNQLRPAPTGVVDELTPVCNAEPLAIQYSLQQLPEFKNQYTIKINDITPVPDNNLQCDVNFIYSSAETGYTKNERRRVTFTRNEEKQPIVDSISQRLNELLEPVAISPKEVLEYYSTLNKYNENWIASGWKLKNAMYNPPLPTWDDPIFMRNIEIYNSNYNSVIDNIKSAAYTPNGVELFKKWIAPVPANPIPPKANKLTVPIKPIAASGSGSASAVDETAINTALASESESAIKNAEATASAQDAYDKYGIPPSSPLYDPPIEGDSFETILIKLLKAYDYAASQESEKRTSSFFSASRDAIASDEDPSKYNRRLVGRYTMNNVFDKFRVPQPVLPPTYSENIDYANSIGYTFNERQQYLIDYAPLYDNRDKEELRVNFCKSLGFQRWTDKCGSAGDCCAPLQNLPKYSGSAAGSAAGSAIEPFASASASNKKCGRSGIQLGGRTLTISVPSPPVNIDTSNRMYTYKMTRPTNGTCKPASAPKATPDEIYNAIRPVLIKELQTTLKNDKMFNLRCPGSCLQ